MKQPEKSASSFEELEAQSAAKGAFSPVPNSDFPLAQWYAGARKKRFDELSLADLSIACRQAIFPEVIVPLAIARLELAPESGDQYDWELLLATNSIPRAYWSSHPEQRNRLARIIEQTMGQMDGEVRVDATSLLKRLVP